MSENKKKISIFDFDQTLMDTPTKEEGAKIWKEKTGEEWPHKGWWGRSESLDMNIFDIKPIDNVVQDYRVEHNDPYTVTVMITGRHEGLREEVTSILEQHGLEFDHYLLKKRSPTIKDKIEKLESLLQKYPEVNTVEIWEDRSEHVEDFQSWGDKKQGIEVIVNHVS